MRPPLQPKRALVGLLRLVQEHDNIVQRAQVALLPLTRYDAEHSGDLIHTLRTYFACNGNASRASQRLFLHRNGLLYRLGRIEELLSISLDNAHVRLSLELALEIAGPAGAPLET